MSRTSSDSLARLSLRPSTHTEAEFIWILLVGARQQGALFPGDKHISRAQGLPALASMPSNAGEKVWELARSQPSNTNGGWLVTEEPLNLGQDLALVVSVTHDARMDAKRAIDRLALPIGRLAHAALQEPGPDAVVDGGHARWLADALARQVRELVVADSPRRLHVFAACPVGLMLLFGQRADAWGPTTVYEFAFEDGSRSYFPGMASGLV
jgi:hypothetical protein